MQTYKFRIAIGPERAEYHNDLGIALLQAGRAREAVSEIDLSLRMDPA